MKIKREIILDYVLIIFFSVVTITFLLSLAPQVFSLIRHILKILMPFIIAMVISFLLHTLVDKLENMGLRRSLAVLIIFLIFIYIIVYLIMNLIPILIYQIDNLVGELPTLYATIQQNMDSFWKNFDFVPDDYRFNVDDIEILTEQFLTGINFNLFNNFGSVLDSFNSIIITPIIIYYFLYDYNNIRSKLSNFLKRKNFKLIRQFLHDIDHNLGQYFRGLLLIMNLLTIGATIGFAIIGLDYPILFGFIVGYTNIIPIIGPYIGGAPAVIFALTKSVKLAIFTSIIIVVCQAIESNILTPYVQSKSINTHPLIILFTIIVFGKYFGLFGMIFSIPILAVILLMIKYLKIYWRFQKYKKQS